MDAPSTAFFSDIGDLANPRAYCGKIDLRNENTDKLIKNYESLLLIRLAEEAIADLAISKKAMCPCHLAIGQEAVAVGVANSLRPDDRGYGAHRSHGHYLASGASLDKLFAEILGKDGGCSKGMGGSMHLYAPEHGFGGSVPIVAGTVPIAVGAALAFKQSKRDSVAIAYFGDGACEEGVVHECLNMASVMNLPIVFVVENNLFSSHLDINLRQPANRVARFADAHLIRAKTIDGNDVVEVSEVTADFVQAARDGKGPGFIEAITYRWRGHVGPNEDIDVGLQRRSEDVAAWKKRDPIARLRDALETTRNVTPEVFTLIRQRVEANIEASLKFAVDSPYPKASALLDRVYAN